ncbi:capsule biosynthesis protein [Sphingomonas crocodyli]|uniref:Capsular biosynthesis protein n=1 Tax=Sphingomonas crocodyli TaxID=1979270 RepID=A0A437M4Y4_9SPHN|nr:capsular biosynthesis protein [Sphingomonas crocodyli]RVT92790.1 capsular biosynthesis protein [Sphingomonas crocodyli]
MKHGLAPQQRFLFLQGPPGPFFYRLAKSLRGLGHRVHRINLNGGDRASWPEKAVDYRGDPDRWPRFVDNFLAEHAITDLVLFGDCRPLHQAARGLAQRRDVRVHVFEEGYIRPHWVTLERDGVNGHSPLPRDPKWFLREARRLPPLGEEAPVPATFRRRAHEATLYYFQTYVGRLRFPHYKSHRDRWVVAEAAGWLKQFALRSVHEDRAEAAIASVAGKRYFALPLQLTSDYQIRVHSPFASMEAGARYVIESFARFAPKDTLLLIKEHPLDNGLSSWARFVRHEAARLDIDDRIVLARGGDINDVVNNAIGVVTVNSTTGTLSLANGIPTVALGEAVYNIPGITFDGPLDEFWANPTPPDPKTWDAFCRVLRARCLVYGGFASDEGIELLVEGSIERMIETVATPTPRPTDFG